MGIRSRIRSWFAAPERYDRYTPGERLIFSYWDGRRQVKADPMMLYKRVAARQQAIESAQKLVASELWKNEEDKRKAHDEMVGYIREAFDLPAPDGLDCSKCLTQPECVELLDTFYMFVGATKKKASPTPISAAETSVSTASTSVGNPPTPSISDSGCVVSGPPTGSPPLSSGESCTPSASSPPAAATSAT